MKTPEEALEEHMNKGTPEDSPYWDLFKIKNEVNDTIVDAYKMGYQEGYKECRDKYANKLALVVAQLDEIKKKVYRHDNMFLADMEAKEE